MLLEVDEIQVGSMQLILMVIQRKPSANFVP
ncbi:hypothetical protein LINPERHAP1_LOCUS21955, partial [Linum perenne]